MARIESVTREVLEQLGKHLDDQIPELNQIIYDFPESNIKLKYPAISMLVTNDDYVNEMPYILKQGELSGYKKDIYYVLGQHNWSIQLDLWERSKEERHDLFERFMMGFNSSLPNPGLNLTLKNYHGISCSYTMTNYSLEDSEVSSQRKEWRAIINIVANCKSVLSKREYIITENPELTLDITDEI